MRTINSKDLHPDQADFVDRLIVAAQSRDFSRLLFEPPRDPRRGPPQHLLSFKGQHTVAHFAEDVGRREAADFVTLDPFEQIGEAGPNVGWAMK